MAFVTISGEYFINVIFKHLDGFGISSTLFFLRDSSESRTKGSAKIFIMVNQFYTRV